jgi:hypothetical protein
MGQQHQTPAPSTTTAAFTDVSDAYDQIQPFLTAQFEFRETGINQICNQLNQVDSPSLGMQLLKSGLKIGLAAAAGAVGAFTGGLGWVALGAIGVAFGVGGEIVDGVFAGPSAPAGVEEYRTNRLNVLTSMKARETSAMRTRLNQTDSAGWQRAFADYQSMQNNAALQRTEMNATLDGWMSALNTQTNGTGGSIGEGEEASTDETTGRLFLQGSAHNAGSGVTVGIASASIDGLDNASLRNMYLDRSVRDIGMFIDLAMYQGGEYGALSFNAGQDNIGAEGGTRFRAGLAMLVNSGPVLTGPDYDWSAHWQDGAHAVKAVLDDYTLRDFGITEVSTPSFN